jgi:hypothetical protein
MKLRDAAQNLLNALDGKLNDGHDYGTFDSSPPAMEALRTALMDVPLVTGSDSEEVVVQAFCEEVRVMVDKAIGVVLIYNPESKVSGGDCVAVHLHSLDALIGALREAKRSLGG